jgi:hypothetical protein
MKTQITKYVIAGLIVVLGFVSWLSVDRAINMPASSTWMVPAIWFSLFFIALSLGVILIKNKLILISVLAVSFLASLIFAFSIWHILVLIFSFFITLAALERMAKDVKLNIKLDLQKSIRTGKAMLIVALAFAITSQYYFETKDTSKANIIPKLEMGNVTSKVLPMFFPNLKSNPKNDLTVDEFILQMSKENSNSILSSLSENSDLSQVTSKISKDQLKKITDKNQEAIFEEGRKNLESIAGTKLTGQEKISDVFSEMINSKINDIFSPAISENNLPIVSLVISLILFLTIISLGPFLGFVAIYLAVFFFWILRKAELIKISKVMVEAEIIE